jgi:hypothetical protein
VILATEIRRWRSAACLKQINHVASFSGDAGCGFAREFKLPIEQLNAGACNCNSRECFGGVGNDECSFEHPFFRDSKPWSDLRWFLPLGHIRHFWRWHRDEFSRSVCRTAEIAATLDTFRSLP